VLHGIDVSVWQGSINWDQVATSGKADFAYIRIGDGLGTDERFVDNWTEARRVGVPRGAYHFFRPNLDPLTQAQHFLDIVERGGGYLPDDLPPMIDVEATGNQSASIITANMRVWMQTVEAATGKRPIIYTGSYFWDDNKLGDGFADHHLWTAHYTSADCPLAPNAWSSWLIWQYSSSGSVAGISGDVDMNRFNGSAEDLALWPRCSHYKPISSCLPPSWWCDAIDTLHQDGILSQPCDAFLSGDSFSRADWALLLGRAIHIEDTEAFALCRLPFVDVSESEPFARHVAALAGLDYGDGETVFSTATSTFEPNRAASRCEGAALVARSWNLAAAPQTAIPYSDASSIPEWCIDPVQRLLALQLLDATAAQFRPLDAMTVGEAASLLLATIQSQGRNTPSASDFSEPSCRAACEDVCVLDSTSCLEDAILYCVAGSNGCTAWSQAQRCPTREACRNDACIDVCVDECRLDETICDGDAIRDCAVDEQGCLLWSAPVDCPKGEVCSDGGCIDPCADNACVEDHVEEAAEDVLEEDDTFPAIRPSTGDEASCSCQLRASDSPTSWLGLLLLGLFLGVHCFSRRH
jgi:GH25 family lysozyme M1 (1,4-beta-N-acetylmuramidase)